MVDRLARILYRGRFFHYPLKPDNTLWNMGVLNAGLCLASYLREKVVPTHPNDTAESYESWIVIRFGRRLFEMFFKSYSKKLWGISCQDLDADFAAQRIKKFSLGQAVKISLGIGKSEHKTLIDRFAYPLGGTGTAYECMAEMVRKRRGEIHLNRPVARIVHENRKITGLVFLDGCFQVVDHVISTMPPTLMVRGLGMLPDEVHAAVDVLRYRNTVIVYLHLQSKSLFPDQWLHVHYPELLVERVTNFRNWSPELYGNSESTILAMKYWSDDGNRLWEECDQSLIDRATDEIRTIGLLSKTSVSDGYVFRIHRCYPVYAKGYKQHLEPIVAFLKTFQGLTPIGRYGTFNYNNQDHSIRMGILASANIIEGKHHDLWSVNTDYECYQDTET